MLLLCRLSEYCRNRVPRSFEETQFVHDTFHKQGHKHCGSAGTWNRIKSADSHIKSTAAERTNTMMPGLRVLLRHVSVKVGLALVCFAVKYHNLRRRRSLGLSF